MSRSKWKGLFLCHSLYKKYLYFKNSNINKFIKIYTRSSTILREFIGTHFKLYNGQKFINVFVSENKVGHKFGEFVFTRKLRKFIHEKKGGKKRNIKKKK